MSQMCEMYQDQKLSLSTFREDSASCLLIRSSFRDDLIKWVVSVRPSVHPFIRPFVHPSIRLLRILFFPISSLITWPTKLKLCRGILDISAHSCSGPDFAISSHGARLWRNFKLIHSLRFLSG